ncbi:TetR family transcriptional regulator [Nocardia sp. CA2R105]|uniref:TetR family transcriptional regulator n=1 Tax=Nocardia coffeae TaxID=2873381 RepID=UPI001CA74FAC|nr:TetR family transcriptional regulator [Nocardia coffeae]MBY8861374.1 TetR family transcriptional regulator [Nocardia coffeae]
MATSSEADTTRERILTAATDEFAQYGIAGARIERIAGRAKTSKERLYAYFRSKQQLYRFVADRELVAMTEATRMDAADLPGYAGRVHDYFMAHPDHLRLMHWNLLEVTDAEAPGDPFQESVRQTVRSGIEQLSQAQAAGYLDPAWDPIDIMVLVNQIALAWAWQPGVVALADGQIRNPSFAARRAAIVAAVARLFPAAAGAEAPPVNPGTDGTSPRLVREDRGVRSCGSG